MYLSVTLVFIVVFYIVQSKPTDCKIHNKRLAYLLNNYRQICYTASQWASVEWKGNAETTL